MPLVGVDTLLEQAQQGNYAVGACTPIIWRLQAIIQAAELERSPVIMQLGAIATPDWSILR